MTLLPFFCGKDCGGNACPLLATVENGRVTRITHNPAAGDFLKGCRRGFYFTHTQYAPDRLLHPLVRVGPRGSGQFRHASWEEASGIVADRLGEIRAKHGASAVLNIGNAGDTTALGGTGPLLARFLSLYGGYTRMFHNYSCGAAGFVLPYLLGEQWTESGFDPATMRHAQMIILWGANVIETRMGPEIPRRLVEAQRRGAQIVIIDPRRSASIQKTSAWWLPVRPGTDAALMLSVLYVLFTEGLADRACIAELSVGFEELEGYVLGAGGGAACTPEWAEGICGLSAGEIRRFARVYAAASPAMLLPGYSIQRVSGGEDTYRLTVALQIATGNFGVRGGSTGSINGLLPGPRMGRLPVPPCADRPGVPVLRWPDAVLQGRAGGYPTDIHAIYNIGSNFLNQGADIRKSIAAFEKVDFSVCHDLFLTPTARWCDVVLPAASPLEKEDIGQPWAGNWALYRPQVVAPLGEARADYDILCDLANRLGFGLAFSEGRSTAEWVQHFMDQSEIPDQSAFRRSGIYLAPDQERVGLADFARDPAHHPLSTPSGRVEIASQRYRADTGVPAIPTWQPLEKDERFPLRLITPKSPHRTHSQGSNIAWAREKAAHALEIHPQDAAARGIANGCPVRIYNQNGAVIIQARCSEDLMPGVVCLPEGVWVEIDATGTDQAGSANMLTATGGTRAATNAIMHGVGVEVEVAS